MRKLKVTNALLGKTYDDIQIYLGQPDKQTELTNDATECLWIINKNEHLICLFDRSTICLDYDIFKE